jgi:hypothetical protein
MASRVALVAVAALLLAFPDFWWQMWRADRSLSVCLVGCVCATSMFVVGTGWGLIHLLGYLRARLRGDSKASLTCSSGGVWDRELDQSLPAVKRIEETSNNDLRIAADGGEAPGCVRGITPQRDIEPYGL